MTPTPGKAAFCGNTVTILPPCHCEAVNQAREFCMFLSNLAPKPEG